MVNDLSWSTSPHRRPTPPVEPEMHTGKVIAWLFGGMVFGVILAWGMTALIDKDSDTVAPAPTNKETRW